ncbi:MAG: transglutaminase domain protein, partial [Paenibacillus sp.]|nr:transglutaminase domain protein [Paenibacillus sp.]
VLTKAVGQEYKKILQRKYEVVDARIPADIAEAARVIAADKPDDEAKARALYQWVGTRIRYDWDKVEQYETKGIWKEQTPEDTFASREGVCIDYSRLYAVMARSVGLEVKVVTGQGYDGRGGYGPHAWNEVLLKDTGTWIPLDSTWVSSGDNWFNPPNFDKTHIRDV